jgi:predicted nucleic acid-binding protein
MEQYIFDACALLTFLKDEEGIEKVEALLEKAENAEISVKMSIINLIEVYYDRIKTGKAANIEEFFAFLQTAPIEVINTISDVVYHETAHLKASYKIALADAIGLATAKELSGQFVTSDHHELEPIEQHEPISFLWLPARPKK